MTDASTNKYSQLPDGIRPYGRSPVFTHDTVPKKLLGAHNLKVGTWGLLTVTQGHVTYFKQDEPDIGLTVTPDSAHLIPQKEMHFITTSEDAEFFIEFCNANAPNTICASSPCSAPDSLPHD